MAKIELRDVGLAFRFWRQRGVTLKDFVIRRLLGRDSQHQLKQIQALQGIDLSLNSGDRLGIVGHNGAGKSTLLRLIAGIYIPTIGTRVVEGRISSLLDLAVGIEPDANGWENIAFLSYLQRQTPADVKRKAGSIAEFCELGDLMDLPVRYYSSGKLVRLIFSIATEIEPEILVIDEVFSAGDLSFQEKAKQRMGRVMDKASILVIASHDMNVIRCFCNRAIWLDHGRIQMGGTPDDVVSAYLAHMDCPAAA